MGNMIRVYVAGPYSADNVIDVLKNIGRGEKVCAELFKRGFAPFCPWHDKSFVTDLPEENFSVRQFYEYSIAWLEVSDCMLLIRDYERSQGALYEIKFAQDHKIPTFVSVDTLENYYKEKIRKINEEQDAIASETLERIGYSKEAVKDLTKKSDEKFTYSIAPCTVDLWEKK